MVKHPFKRYGEEFKDALKDLRNITTDRMGAVQVAEIFKADKNVTARKQRRQLLRHLRHHSGKNCSELQYKVQILCYGHIEVYQNSVEHAYEDGAAKVTVDYTMKNVDNEAAAQPTHQVRSRDITPA